MTFKSFNKRFNSLHFCKVFPNAKYNYYCMRGQWVGNEAGGPLVTVRDREAVIKDAAESKFKAIHKVILSTALENGKPSVGLYSFLNTVVGSS